MNSYSPTFISHVYKLPCLVPIIVVFAVGQVAVVGFLFALLENGRLEDDEVLIFKQVDGIFVAVISMILKGNKDLEEPLLDDESPKGSRTSKASKNSKRSKKSKQKKQQKQQAQESAEDVELVQPQGDETAPSYVRRKSELVQMIEQANVETEAQMDELVEEMERKSFISDEDKQEFNFIKKDNAGLVTVNIGGVKYFTTKKTLSAAEYFETMFENPKRCIFDDDGDFFVDRPGELFQPLLKVLRTGVLDVPKGLHLSEIMEEAEFFGIELPKVNTNHNEVIVKMDSTIDEDPDAGRLGVVESNQWLRFADARPFPDRGYWTGCPKFSGNCTSLGVLICMFNEDDAALLRTWKSVIENMDYCRIKGVKVETHVVIIQDGWSRGSPEMKAVANQMVGDGEWRAHLEADTAAGRTETYIVQPDESQGKFRYSELPITLVTKTQNRLKHNSHEWFCGEGSYADIIRPDYMYLVDVGSVFDKDCIYHMIQHLNHNPKTGACTGWQHAQSREQQQEEEDFWLFSAWYRAVQIFEFEDIAISANGTFGMVKFLDVIPGPCGMYRVKHMIGEPTDWYFGIMNSDPRDMGILDGNLNLTEDRILSLSCLLKTKEEQVTAYLPQCHFYSECMITMKGFVKQRRRWITGTVCMYLFLMNNIGTLWRSNLAFWRKLFVTKLLFIMLLRFVGRAFGPAIFIQYAYFGLKPLFGPDAEPLWLWWLLVGQYFFFVVWISREKDNFQGRMFHVLALLWAGIFATSQYGIFLAIVESLDFDSFKGILLLALLCVPIIPIALSFLYYQRAFWRMMASIIPYFLFLPTFELWFPAYSFSRAWDLRWGNRTTTDAFAGAKKKRIKMVGRFIAVILVIVNMGALALIWFFGTEWALWAFVILVGFRLYMIITSAMFHTWLKISKIYRMCIGKDY